ncbi:MAG: toxin-antitoxin system YwqK family antitoxin [Flavobacteriaceae bacterium]|nr:toxin-antitoxin system YwqK family antitoxin [Flavobacteriaceae bacterium]
MIKQISILLFGFVISLTPISLTAQEKNQLDSQGQRHGYWSKNFDGTDQPRYQGQFEHGQETGLFKYYKLVNGKSLLSATKEFDLETDIAEVQFLSSEGNLISKGKMKGRLFIGPWVYYHNDSDIVMTTETYNENGKLDGERIVYYPDGKIAERVIYDNGKIDGLNIWYLENGKVLKELNYTNGELHGEAKYFNPEGILIVEGQYQNGKKNGIWKYYEDGKLKETKDYSAKSQNPKKN